MKSNNKKQNRAALYIRVSSGEISEDARYDDTRYCNSEIQKNDLRQFCRIQGYVLNDQHIYEDISCSGVSSIKKRPALKKLIKDAKEKRFDAVMVYGVGRIATNFQMFKNIMNELEKIGVDFFFMTESVCFPSIWHIKS